MPDENAPTNGSSAQENVSSKNDDGMIDLSEQVADEIEHRIEKRQEMAQKTQEKMEAFEAAREEFNDQIESNQTYLEAVANVNGVSMEDYVYDFDIRGLREMTDEERRQREQQQPTGESSPAEKPISTEMSTEDVIFYIRENGPDSIQIPEEEDRALVLEEIADAQ